MPDLDITLDVDILAQPDDVTCGPTCLHALYRYYQDEVPLDDLIQQVPQIEGGGTLAVILGKHALLRGYSAKVYTYNVQIYDPTWFTSKADLRAKLREQKAFKKSPRLHRGTDAYLDFLELGGRVLFEDLTASLICKYLQQGIPILTGLSATYLYHTMREYGPNMDEDDVRGEPTGHFVVLCGYDQTTRMVDVADPLHTSVVSGKHRYPVGIDRVINAVLLGVVTYDCNLLIIEPSPDRRARTPCKS